jgi:hypothetical protein
MATCAAPPSHLQRVKRSALKWQESTTQGRRTFKRKLLCLQGKGATEGPDLGVHAGACCEQVIASREMNFPLDMDSN